MNETCDLCRSEALELIYTPATSRKKLGISICTGCGLVQSLPRGVKAGGRSPRLSYGADFGNLRYHKGMMVPRVLAFIEKYVDVRRRRSILDIGSNRGGLIEALHAIHPSGRYTGVEPDERVVNSYKSHRWLKLYVDRFERVDFGDNRFDCIMCLHTLEHADSAREMLEKIRSLLSSRGCLFLEVPHIGQIDKEGVIEELFIDKHFYHFSRFTLTRLLRKCGFRIIGIDAKNEENLSVIAVKAEPERIRKVCVGREVRLMKALVHRYEAAFQRNLRNLSKVAAFIRKNRDKRIVLWGAGRIFNAFVTHSDISARDIAGVVDEYLRFERVGGFSIYRSSDLRALAPDIIVIFSREYDKEIRARIAGILGKQVKILSYGSLLT